MKENDSKAFSVLVVEDDKGNQFLMKKTLERYAPDIKIFQAHDGKEALNMIDMLAGVKQKPDVILLDVLMPVMNGMEFLKKFSENEHAADTIVVILTSVDRSQDIEKAKMYDFVKHYAVKPLSKQDIYIIQSFL